MSRARELPPVIVYRGRVYRLDRIAAHKPGDLQVDDPWSIVSSTDLTPGDRVELAIDLEPPPPMGFPRPPYVVSRGDRGWVARIIHCTVEGEPVEGPSINPIVHVRFDNQTQVLAFAPSCLRKVDDPSEHPPRLELVRGGGRGAPRTVRGSETTTAPAGILSFLELLPGDERELEARAAAKGIRDFGPLLMWAQKMGLLQRVPMDGGSYFAWLTLAGAIFMVQNRRLAGARVVPDEEPS